MKSVLTTNNKTGFTLVELLTAVAIIGALVLIAVPAYQRVVWQAREKKAITNLYNIYNAEKSFFAVNFGTYSNQTTTLQTHVNFPLADGFWTYSVQTYSSFSRFTATATGINYGTRHVYIDQSGSTTKDF